MTSYRLAALFLALALPFLSPGSTTAGWEVANAAYERGDYQTAFRELVPLAVAGDPLAQHNLGVMYHHGQGVPRNYAEAVRWYRTAAAQGNAKAQFNLGLMYLRGQGVAQNDAEAMRWYRRAADHGHAGAQSALGAMYALGRGAPQGDVLAYVWLNVAAARLPQGEKRSQTVQLRDEVDAELSPAQRARAQEMARNWRPTVAARSEGGAPAYGDARRSEPRSSHAERSPSGSPVKDFPLTYGRVPATPRFAVPPLIEPPADTGAATSGFDEGFTAYKRGDYPTAFGQFMPLAVAGDSWAQMYLGMMYVDVENYVEAARWFRSAGDQGIALAQFSLGMMYYEGRGIPRNYVEAARWLRMAAAQGEALAQSSLGAMYGLGQGVPQNYAEAVRWLRMAAAQGEAQAQHNLGMMYARGLGVPQDDVQAYMWLTLAAALEPELRDVVAEALDTVAARLSPTQLARARDMLRNWRLDSQPVPQVASPPRALTDEESAALEAVQAKLAALGYDPGPADGVLGQRTRAAIRAFQADVGLPVDGQVSDQLIAALSDAGANGRSAGARTAAADPGSEGTGARPWERHAKERRLEGTGTGFAVSRDGQIVTNHHVVADCAEVRVRPAGQDAMAGAVVARDAGNDLALLKAPVRLPVAEIGDARGIRAGDSVVAVGFPLPGLLASEANVTTGTVSALAGIGDDTRFLQMTVPVQPGSSGGPLLDLDGRVVGVVVSKLDALKVASVTGDIPQNVNFAIKAGVLRSFLDASAVGVAHRDPLAEPAYPITLSPASVGADAKAFTVMVECWK